MGLLDATLLLSASPRRGRSGSRHTSVVAGATAVTLTALLATISGCDRAEARPSGDVASTARAPGPASAVTTAAPSESPPSAHAGNGAPVDAPSRAGDAPSRARDASSVDGPRVYAKTRFVWVRPRAEWSRDWIGYLWHGESVKLRSESPLYGHGCGTWYAVMPRGYVCVDGKRATLDPNDAEYVAVAAHMPDYTSPSPHHYAGSLGAQRYESLPSPDDQRAREPDLAQHSTLMDLARGGGRVDPTLTGIDLSPSPTDAVAFASLPVQIQIPRRSFRRDSTIAYFGEYEHAGRSFLLTSDFAWVPKDRVRLYAPVAFHGVSLGEGVKLPIALFREHDRPSYRQREDGGFGVTKDVFSRLDWVTLTGRSEIRHGVVYLETARDGLWVLAADAVVPKPSDRTPWGASMGATSPAALRPKGRGTWIEASVYGGWLIAYEDTIPVFVTLMAPGRGGVAVPERDPTKTSATPTGQFMITGKFLTATMDAPDDVTHVDVPWVQNFSGPHAIHAAYWHDAWGERVSGGCLNVSPADARRLFEFTEPAVPDGWHGVVWDPHLEPATIVLIHP